MRSQSFTILALAAVAAAATASLAPAPRGSFGPPLVCFPYDIGEARSLPWGSPAEAFDVDPKYPAERLVGDTLELLAGSKDVLVHMETLRRAAIYAARFDEKPGKGTPAGKATKGRDPGHVDRLLVRILDRALEGIAADPTSPLPWLDAGYALGAAAHMGSSHGATFVEHFEKARALAAADPALAFAASAAHLDGADRDRWQTHYRAALAAAPEGTLLRKNVLAYGEHYLGREKMEEILGPKASPDPKKTKG